MPVTKSAKRALRVDRTRTVVNKSVIKAMKTAIRNAKSKPSKETVSQAYSAIDKANKKGLIKENKASRIKSRLVASLKSMLDKSPFGA